MYILYLKSIGDTILHLIERFHIEIHRIVKQGSFSPCHRSLRLPRASGVGSVPQILSDPRRSSLILADSRRSSQILTMRDAQRTAPRGFTRGWG